MLEPNFFYGKLAGILWMKIVLPNFSSIPLFCNPALFPGENSPSNAKCIFPESGEEIKP